MNLKDLFKAPDLGKSLDLFKKGKIAQGVGSLGELASNPITRAMEKQIIPDDTKRQELIGGIIGATGAVLAAPAVMGATGASGAAGAGATGAAGATGTTGATTASNTSLFKNLSKINDIANLVKKQNLATGQQEDPYYNDNDIYRNRINTAQRPQVNYPRSYY